MKDFLNNWNYKKHVVTCILAYGAIGIVGNSFFKKECTDVKKCILEMPKGQKIFNGILAGCLALDLTVSVPALKYIRSKLED